MSSAKCCSFRLGLDVLKLIPAWISDHMPSKMWDEITYTFSNFNGRAVEFWEWVSNFIFIMDVITYTWWD